MNQNEMIQSLRAEIAKLQRVLDLLLDQSTGADEVRHPGRPKGSANKGRSINPGEFAPKKRTMSTEGKARIAAAQKKRWATQRAASTDRSVRKQATFIKKTSKTALPQSPRKAAPVPTVKKSAGAGTRPGLVQERTATVAPSKSAPKKTSAKKTTKPATKRQAKQVAQAGPEAQATA